MQWLKRVVPKLLVVAALAVVIGTLFSGHDSEYGTVTLPKGGVVALPEGTAEVFIDEGSALEGGHRLSSPLRFEVTPLNGGAALTKDPATNEGSGEAQVERSEGIASKGAVATVEVPSAGDYRISGGLESNTPAKLTFGTDAFMAVVGKWKLCGGLLAAAFLFSLIPVPKRESSADTDLHSSRGSATSAYQPARVDPYNG